jgi:hypothetical protein
MRRALAALLLFTTATARADVSAPANAQSITLSGTIRYVGMPIAAWPFFVDGEGHLADVVVIDPRPREHVPATIPSQRRAQAVVEAVHVGDRVRFAPSPDHDYRVILHGKTVARIGLKASLELHVEREGLYGMYCDRHQGETPFFIVGYVGVAVVTGRDG